jgi:hypothetical protein
MFLHVPFKIVVHANNKRLPENHSLPTLWGPLPFIRERTVSEQLYNSKEEEN